jgi:hypothetical protein
MSARLVDDALQESVKRERPYIVTISEGRQRRRLVRWARSWHACFLGVLDEFSQAYVSSVRPLR